MSGLHQLRSRRVGLALSGGSVRGLAHLGVVKVLSEAGIRPAVITGTSAGSLIGAMLAAGMDWSEIASLARKTFWPKLLHGETLERFCAEHLPATFAEPEAPVRSPDDRIARKASGSHHHRRTCFRDQRELRPAWNPAAGQTRREAPERRRHRLRSAVGSMPGHGCGLHHRLRCLGSQLVIARRRH